MRAALCREAIELRHAAVAANAVASVPTIWNHGSRFAAGGGGAGAAGGACVGMARGAAGGAGACVAPVGAWVMAAGVVIGVLAEAVDVGPAAVPLVPHPVTTADTPATSKTIEPLVITAA